MPTFLAVFLAALLFQVSVQAADKIRIGFAPGASSTPFPLAQKKGFLKEEGFENGFRLIIEEIKELARVSREVALSDVADLAILREAQKELGIKEN